MKGQAGHCVIVLVDQRLVVQAAEQMGKCCGTGARLAGGAALSGVVEQAMGKEEGQYSRGGIDMVQAGAGLGS